MKMLLVAGAAAIALAAAAAPAQALVIGTADSSNTIPFGSQIGGFAYQQIYSAAAFNGTIDILGLSFFNTLAPGQATPRTGNFDIFLSVSNLPIATFDTTPLTFPLAPATKVFSGALPTLQNGRMDFNLSNAFHYDPSAGNLLLTVTSFDFGSGTLSLDTDRNVGVMNRRFNSFTSDDNLGLVTAFTPVPEPAAWALMIGGFGLAGAGLRRRRTSLTT